MSCLQHIWAMPPLPHVSKWNVAKNRDDITYFVLSWRLHLGINSPWNIKDTNILKLYSHGIKKLWILTWHS